MPGTVRMEVCKLDRATKNQQEPEQGDEQNAREAARSPDFVAERHNYS